MRFIRDLQATCDSNSFTDIRDDAIIRLLPEGVRVGELLYADGSGRRILLEQATIRALQRYLRARAEHPMADRLAKHLWLMLIRRSRRARLRPGTINPGNAASLASIASFGFTQTGSGPVARPMP